MSEPRRFDVFLSYNRKDASAALALAETLRDCNLSVWLDVWELRPGLTWQDGVSQGLAESRSCAVLIGAEGYGGWQKREMQASLVRQGAEYPVIPILLPGAPERDGIGEFLGLLTWVDLRSGVQDRAGIQRLIWGITGFRLGAGTERLVPDAKGDARPPLDRFSIITPRDGDLLSSATLFEGLGPPNERMRLYARRPGSDWFEWASERTTDADGRWRAWGPPSFERGAYEVFVAGDQNAMASQPVTLFFQDTRHFSAATARSPLGARQVRFEYRLYEAYIEGTKLRRRQVIYSGRKIAQLSGALEAAKIAGEEIADALVGKLPRGELEVRIQVGPDRSIQLTPSSAWLLYYAFPTPFTLRSDPNFLLHLSIGQMVWHVEPGIGRLPANPFAGGFKAASEYLEVRHEGYKPGFLSLSGVQEGTHLVRLTPVLNQRIAVLGFPGSEDGGEVSSLSQIMTSEIAQALERRPELGTYAYLDAEPGAGSWGCVPEIGNEILMPDDVRLIEAHLETFDTSFVSGEGRYLQRRQADIHYIVSGNYSVS